MLVKGVFWYWRLNLCFFYICAGGYYDWLFSLYTSVQEVHCGVLHAVHVFF